MRGQKPKHVTENEKQSEREKALKMWGK